MRAYTCNNSDTLGRVLLASANVSNFMDTWI